MNRGKSSKVAASVRRRLLNIIRETGDDANLVWTRYAAERLLYRLSVSEYAEDFILGLSHVNRPFSYRLSFRNRSGRKLFHGHFDPKRLSGT